MAYTLYPSLLKRTVFISGGSSGLGAELVRAFAVQGGQVAFCGTKPGGGDGLIGEITQAGHPAPYYEACDVRDIAALQQLLGQVAWGKLDILIIDLPPGTGDIQLTLCQRTDLTGAIVVSTPQDVALLDARKALDMFDKLKTPVLGLIENMSTYICPNCGHEDHIFGHGGVRAEAEALGLPFLGELPLSIDVRLAGDAGTPIAAGDGPHAQAYAKLARRLIDGGMA